VRTSLSEPLPKRDGPFWAPGDEYQVIDTGRLPTGSAIVVDDIPDGHAVITGATPAEIQNAIVDRGWIR
jgi:hypothetical protein